MQNSNVPPEDETPVPTNHRCIVLVCVTNDPGIVVVPVPEAPNLLTRPGLLQNANLQPERIPPPIPSSESLLPLLKLLTYVNYCVAQNARSAEQKTKVILRRRQLRNASKSNVSKTNASCRTEREQIISRRGTMNSIIRGVSHIQTCGGCDRLICGSTYRLVRQCAQHVRTCALLSCSQCVSCRIARMVQIAWRAARDRHREMPSKSKQCGS
jgi:hypothetical protein